MKPIKPEKPQRDGVFRHFWAIVDGGKWEKISDRDRRCILQIHDVLPNTRHKIGHPNQDRKKTVEQARKPPASHPYGSSETIYWEELEGAR